MIKLHKDCHTVLNYPSLEAITEHPNPNAVNNTMIEDIHNKNQTWMMYGRHTKDHIYKPILMSSNLKSIQLSHTTLFLFIFTLLLFLTTLASATTIPMNAQLSSTKLASGEFNDPHRMIKTMHVFPHSHTDAGWIFPYHQYYTESVRRILQTSVDALINNPSRRFVWPDIMYLTSFYYECDEETKHRLHFLIANNQFELVSGGMTMNDQSVVSFSNVFHDMTVAQDWIYSKFRQKIKFGWSIDPFGLSASQLSLWSEMGYKSALIMRSQETLKKPSLSPNPYTAGTQLLWQPHSKLKGTTNPLLVETWDNYTSDYWLFEEMQGFLPVGELDQVVWEYIFNNVDVLEWVKVKIKHFNSIGINMKEYTIDDLDLTFADFKAKYPYLKLPHPIIPPSLSLLSISSRIQRSLLRFFSLRFSQIVPMALAQAKFTSTLHSSIPYGCDFCHKDAHHTHLAFEFFMDYVNQIHLFPDYLPDLMKMSSTNCTHIDDFILLTNDETVPLFGCIHPRQGLVIKFQSTLLYSTFSHIGLTPNPTHSSNFFKIIHDQQDDKFLGYPWVEMVLKLRFSNNDEYFTALQHEIQHTWLHHNAQSNFTPKSAPDTDDLQVQSSEQLDEDVEVIELDQDQASTNTPNSNNNKNTNSNDILDQNIDFTRLLSQHFHNDIITTIIPQTVFPFGFTPRAFNHQFLSTDHGGVKDTKYSNGHNDQQSIIPQYYLQHLLSIPSTSNQLQTVDKIHQSYQIDDSIHQLTQNGQNIIVDRTIPLLAFPTTRLFDTILPTNNQKINNGSKTPPQYLGFCSIPTQPQGLVNRIINVQDNVSVHPIQFTLMTASSLFPIMDEYWAIHSLQRIWSGFYTTRPWVKQAERSIQTSLQMIESMSVFSMSNDNRIIVSGDDNDQNGTQSIHSFTPDNGKKLFSDLFWWQSVGKNHYFNQTTKSYNINTPTKSPLSPDYMTYLNSFDVSYSCVDCVEHDDSAIIDIKHYKLDKVGNEKDTINLANAIPINERTKYSGKLLYTPGGTFTMNHINTSTQTSTLNATPTTTSSTAHVESSCAALSPFEQSHLSIIRNASTLLQHHDAITATSPMVTMEDYYNQITKASESINILLSSYFSDVLALPRYTYGSTDQFVIELDALMKEIIDDKIVQDVVTKKTDRFKQRVDTSSSQENFGFAEPITGDGDEDSGLCFAPTDPCADGDTDDQSGDQSGAQGNVLLNDSLDFLANILSELPQIDSSQYGIPQNMTTDDNHTIMDTKQESSPDNEQDSSLGSSQTNSSKIRVFWSNGASNSLSGTQCRYDPLTQTSRLQPTLVPIVVHNPTSHDVSHHTLRLFNLTTSDVVLLGPNAEPIYSELISVLLDGTVGTGGSNGVNYERGGKSSDNLKKQTRPKNFPDKNYRIVGGEEVHFPPLPKLSKGDLFGMYLMFLDGELDFNGDLNDFIKSYNALLSKKPVTSTSTAKKYQTSHQPPVGNINHNSHYDAWSGYMDSIDNSEELGPITKEFISFQQELWKIQNTNVSGSDIEQYYQPRFSIFECPTIQAEISTIAHQRTRNKANARDIMNFYSKLKKLVSNQQENTNTTLTMTDIANNLRKTPTQMNRFTKQHFPYIIPLYNLYSAPIRLPAMSTKVFWIVLNSKGGDCCHGVNLYHHFEGLYSYQQQQNIPQISRYVLQTPDYVNQQKDIDNNTSNLLQQWHKQQKNSPNQNSAKKGNSIINMSELCHFKVGAGFGLDIYCRDNLINMSSQPTKHHQSDSELSKPIYSSPFHPSQHAPILLSIPWREQVVPISQSVNANINTDDSTPDERPPTHVTAGVCNQDISNGRVTLTLEGSCGYTLENSHLASYVVGGTPALLIQQQEVHSMFDPTDFVTIPDDFMGANTSPRNQSMDNEFYDKIQNKTKLHYKTPEPMYNQENLPFYYQYYANAFVPTKTGVSGQYFNDFGQHDDKLFKNNAPFITSSIHNDKLANKTATHTISDQYTTPFGSIQQFQTPVYSKYSIPTITPFSLIYLHNSINRAANQGHYTYSSPDHSIRAYPMWYPALFDDIYHQYGQSNVIDDGTDGDEQLKTPETGDNTLLTSLVSKTPFLSIFNSLFSGLSSLFFNNNIIEVNNQENENNNKVLTSKILQMINTSELFSLSSSFVIESYSTSSIVDPFSLQIDTLQQQEFMSSFQSFVITQTESSTPPIDPIKDKPTSTEQTVKQNKTPKQYRNNLLFAISNYNSVYRYGDFSPISRLQDGIYPTVFGQSLSFSKLNDLHIMKDNKAAQNENKPKPKVSPQDYNVDLVSPGTRSFIIKGLVLELFTTRTWSAVKPHIAKTQDIPTMIATINHLRSIQTGQPVTTTSKDLSELKTDHLSDESDFTCGCQHVVPTTSFYQMSALSASFLHPECPCFSPSLPHDSKNQGVKNTVTTHTSINRPISDFLGSDLLNQVDQFNVYSNTFLGDLFANPQTSKQRSPTIHQTIRIYRQTDGLQYQIIANMGSNNPSNFFVRVQTGIDNTLSIDGSRQRDSYRPAFYIDDLGMELVQKKYNRHFFASGNHFPFISQVMFKNEYPTLVSHPALQLVNSNQLKNVIDDLDNGTGVFDYNNDVLVNKRHQSSPLNQQPLKITYDPLQYSTLVPRGYSNIPNHILATIANDNSSINDTIPENQSSQKTTEPSNLYPTAQYFGVQQFGLISSRGGGANMATTGSIDFMLNRYMKHSDALGVNEVLQDENLVNFDGFFFFSTNSISRSKVSVHSNQINDVKHHNSVDLGMVESDLVHQHHIKHGLTHLLTQFVDKVLNSTRIISTGKNDLTPAQVNDRSKYLIQAINHFIENNLTTTTTKATKTPTSILQDKTTNNVNHQSSTTITDNEYSPQPRRVCDYNRLVQGDKFGLFDDIHGTGINTIYTRLLSFLQGHDSENQPQNTAKIMQDLGFPLDFNNFSLISPKKMFELNNIQPKTMISDIKTVMENEDLIKKIDSHVPQSYQHSLERIGTGLFGVGIRGLLYNPSQLTYLPDYRSYYQGRVNNILGSVHAGLIGESPNSKSPSSKDTYERFSQKLNQYFNSTNFDGYLPYLEVGVQPGDIHYTSNIAHSYDPRDRIMGVTQYGGRLQSNRHGGPHDWDLLGGNYYFASFPSKNLKRSHFVNSKGFDFQEKTINLHPEMPVDGSGRLGFKDYMFHSTRTTAGRAARWVGWSRQNTNVMHETGNGNSSESKNTLAQNQSSPSGYNPSLQLPLAYSMGRSMPYSAPMHLVFSDDGGMNLGYSDGSTYTSLSNHHDPIIQFGPNNREKVITARGLVDNNKNWSININEGSLYWAITGLSSQQYHYHKIMDSFAFGVQSTLNFESTLFTTFYKDVILATCPSENRDDDYVCEVDDFLFMLTDPKASPFLIAYHFDKEQKFSINDQLLIYFTDLIRSNYYYIQYGSSRYLSHTISSDGKTLIETNANTANNNRQSTSYCLNRHLFFGQYRFICEDIHLFTSNHIQEQLKQHHIGDGGEIFKSIIPFFDPKHTFYQQHMLYLSQFQAPDIVNQQQILITQHESFIHTMETTQYIEKNSIPLTLGQFGSEQNREKQPKRPGSPTSTSSLIPFSLKTALKIDQLSLLQGLTSPLFTSLNYYEGSLPCVDDNYRGIAWDYQYQPSIMTTHSLPLKFTPYISTLSQTTLRILYHLLAQTGLESMKSVVDLLSSSNDIKHKHNGFDYVYHLPRLKQPNHTTLSSPSLSYPTILPKMTFLPFGLVKDGIKQASSWSEPSENHSFTPQPSPFDTNIPFSYQNEMIKIMNLDNNGDFTLKQGKCVQIQSLQPMCSFISNDFINLSTLPSGPVDASFHDDASVPKISITKNTPNTSPTNSISPIRLRIRSLSASNMYAYNQHGKRAQGLFGGNGSYGELPSTIHLDSPLITLHLHQQIFNNIQSMCWINNDSGTSDEAIIDYIIKRFNQYHNIDSTLDRNQTVSELVLQSVGQSHSEYSSFGHTPDSISTGTHEGDTNSYGTGFFTKRAFNLSKIALDNNSTKGDKKVSLQDDVCFRYTPFHEDIDMSNDEKKLHRFVFTILSKLYQDPTQPYSTQIRSIITNPRGFINGQLSGNDLLMKTYLMFYPHFPQLLTNYIHSLQHKTTSISFNSDLITVMSPYQQVNLLGLSSTIYNSVTSTDHIATTLPWLIDDLKYKISNQKKKLDKKSTGINSTTTKSSTNINAVNSLQCPIMTPVQLSEHLTIHHARIVCPVIPTHRHNGDIQLIGQRGSTSVLPTLWSDIYLQSGVQTDYYSDALLGQSPKSHNNNVLSENSNPGASLGSSKQHRVRLQVDNDSNPIYIDFDTFDQCTNALNSIALTIPHNKGNDKSEPTPSIIQLVSSFGQKVISMIQNQDEINDVKATAATLSSSITASLGQIMKSIFGTFLPSQMTQQRNNPNDYIKMSDRVEQDMLSAKSKSKTSAQTSHSGVYSADRLEKSIFGDLIYQYHSQLNPSCYCASSFQQSNDEIVSHINNNNAKKTKSSDNNIFNEITTQLSSSQESPIPVYFPSQISSSFDPSIDPYLIEFGTGSNNNKQTLFLTLAPALFKTYHTYLYSNIIYKEMSDIYAVAKRGNSNVDAPSSTKSTKKSQKMIESINTPQGTLAVLDYLEHIDSDIDINTHKRVVSELTGNDAVGLNIGIINNVQKRNHFYTTISSKTPVSTPKNDFQQCHRELHTKEDRYSQNSWIIPPFDQYTTIETIFHSSNQNAKTTHGETLGTTDISEINIDYAAFSSQQQDQQLSTPKQYSQFLSFALIDDVFINSAEKNQHHQIFTDHIPNFGLFDQELSTSFLHKVSTHLSSSSGSGDKSIPDILPQPDDDVNDDGHEEIPIDEIEDDGTIVDMPTINIINNDHDADAGPQDTPSHDKTEDKYMLHHHPSDFLLFSTLMFLILFLLLMIALHGYIIQCGKKCFSSPESMKYSRVGRYDYDNEIPDLDDSDVESDDAGVVRNN